MASSTLNLAETNVYLIKAFTVIEKMFAKKLIHRDISIANVMLEPFGDLFRGLLIDYDYAIHLDRVGGAAAGRRTVSKCRIPYK